MSEAPVEAPIQPPTTPEQNAVKSTAHATSAIQHEFWKLMRLQGSGNPNGSVFGDSLKVHIPDESNMYTWHIVLQPALFWDALQEDLRHHASLHGGSAAEGTSVVMEIIFSEDFPFKPPSLRIISPRFVPGTGHVMRAGSICIELLTDSGWSPAYSLESVLVHVISFMNEAKARIDFKDPRYREKYSERLARETFAQAASVHRWKI